MKRATFRLYEELNDYLPEEKRKTDFQAAFGGDLSIAKALEKLGVPLEEVDLILVNGRSSNADRLLRDGDRVSVFPVFESLNIEGLTRVREKPLRRTRFMADPRLKTTADYLRRLGFDVAFAPSLPPDRLLEIAEKEKRILLTDDSDLLKSAEPTRAIYLPPGKPQDHLKRIRERLNL